MSASSTSTSLTPAPLLCREILDADDDALPALGALYEATQHIDERIPWAWIARAPKRRQTWRPGMWCPHLVSAHERSADTLGPPIGFVYGAHLPILGAYVSYLGVDPKVRQRGIGTRLFEVIFRLLAVDAAMEGVPLPFILWESRRPAPEAPADAWDLWQARLRLFQRVGAWWIAQVDCLTPNYHDDAGPPVPLQLFLVPRDEPLEHFTSQRLRDVVDRLLRGVYRRGPGDPLYEGTLRAEVVPQLRPPLDAWSPPRSWA